MSIIDHDIVTLSAGAARCQVVPGAGGAIAGFWWERAGLRYDWLRPAAPATIACRDAGAMGCFPTVPYGNRIRDGRFIFCGEEVLETPSPGLRHTLYGHGWRRDWTVIERREDRLSVAYTHDADAWPWSYRVRQSFALSSAALAITLEIENLSERLMPTGLGFRLAFPRTPRTSLRAAAGGAWRMDAQGMPLEEMAIPSEWDLAAGSSLEEFDLEGLFTGWDGRMTLAWPERGARLGIEATHPLLSFLAVSSTRQADCFWVEPASHCADAINLAREGVAGTGIRVLTPGARRVADMMLRPELA